MSISSKNEKESEINIAYDMLLKTTTILPDGICVMIIQKIKNEAKTEDQKLMFLPSFESPNYQDWNQTSVGNCLAILRAFGSVEKYQVACKKCLKGWLEYMYINRKQWKDFEQSVEISQILFSFCVTTPLDFFGAK
jgi:hypothetical protein